MHSRGFTLVEFMITIAVIAIVLGVAIPSLMASRKSSNEASAIASLRTVNAVNQQYKTRFGRFAGSLANLSASGMIDQTLGAGQKAGFNFTYFGTTTSWTTMAAPTTSGVTGNRSFFVDQTGVLRFAATGTATSASPPLQ